LDDCQDPDYHSNYPNEMSETSDSAAKVINRLEAPPSSIIQSVAKISVSTDKKSKNIKNSVH